MMLSLASGTNAFRPPCTSIRIPYRICTQDGLAEEIPKNFSSAARLAAHDFLLIQNSSHRPRKKLKIDPLLCTPCAIDHGFVICMSTLGGLPKWDSSLGCRCSGNSNGATFQDIKVTGISVRKSYCTSSCCRSPATVLLGQVRTNG